MIKTAMNGMENSFRADLNGWLEHNSRYPVQDRLAVKSEHSKENRIYDNFEQTMEYYSHTEKAKEALHNVIFYALIKHKDFGTDFDIPRFAETIRHKDYLDLIRDYDLYAFTKRELWKLDLEFALRFLDELCAKSQWNLPIFYKTYLQLALCLEDDEKYTSRLTRLISLGSVSTDYMSYSLRMMEAVYECIDGALKTANRRRDRNESTQLRLDRLFRFMNALSILAKNEENGTVPSDDRLWQKQCMSDIFHATVALVEENGYTGTSIFRLWYELFGKETSRSTESLMHPRFVKDDSSPKIILNTKAVDSTLEVSDKSRRSPLTLKEFVRTIDYQNTTESHHENTFGTILSYILLKSLPNQVDKNSIVSAEEGPGLDRLEKSMTEKYGGCQMLGLKLGCVQIIRDRNMFWRSILKVIIQFLDLWVSDILEAKCADIFASLIARENMMSVLYQHILKHVQHYSLRDNSTTVEMIKKLSHLLEKCFDHVESNQQLLIFRDHVFNSRDVNEDVRLPILGSTSFWNIPFDRGITKVTNQITTFEDDVQVPEEIIKKLIILSIIWPYEVVRQLFLSCVQNKNQYKAIIPVLQNLGNLCILGSIRKKHSEQLQNQKNDTLLLLVLKDTISINNSAFVETYTGNICQFLGYCCYDKSVDQNFPLILKSNSSVDQSLLLLNFKDILNHCVLQNLTSFFQHGHDTSEKTSKTNQHLVLLRFALYILNSFCESPLADKFNWSNAIIKMSDLPAILYCSPETYLVCFTELLELRIVHEKKPSLLRLQDWESALSFVEKFSDIIQKGIHFPLIHQIFCKTLFDYDWKIQLLWFNVIRSVSKNALLVPRALFQITGELDNVFHVYPKAEVLQAATTSDMEGWYDLFEACKMSTKLTDELFRCSDQWMYNLLLLWKHPYEDTITHNCLYHTLYPKSSLSASIEYPKLLTYFLGKLYDSFTGAHEVIQDYTGYERPEMISIIKNLSEEGTKQYFIVLHIMRLLKRNMNQDRPTDDKQDNYFISSLIKVLQDLTNWANISQQGQATSYNELKSRTKTLMIPDIPTAAHNSANIIMEQDKDNSTLEDTNSNAKIIYYPLLSTAELISDRALSILSFYHLCSLFHGSSNKVHEIQQQAIERLMLQIMGGFIDMISRQNFRRMLQQQPKSRITSWKKKKSKSKFVMLIRPILTPSEENLLKPLITGNVPNADQILRALGLKSTCVEEDDKKKSNKQYLYIS